jgi:hypothetical protein
MLKVFWSAQFMTVFRQNSPYLDSDPKVDLPTRTATFEHLPEKHDWLQGKLLVNQENSPQNMPLAPLKRLAFQLLTILRRLLVVLSNYTR